MALTIQAIQSSINARTLDARQLINIIADYLQANPGGGLQGPIVNADVAASAAIAYSKLNLTGAILNADLAGSIADAKISSAATWNAMMPLAGGTMTGALLADDGSIALPSVAFNSAAGTGFSWDSANGTGLNLSVAGVRAGLVQFHPAVGTTANGQGNTFLGYKAGVLNYSTASLGYNNTFIGGMAGQANTTGAQNTFIGSSCGALNTTGYENIFIGQGAGYNNLTAFGSVYIGWHAGLNIIGDTGFTGNTAVGNQAGQGAIGSTANSNVFVGYRSGLAVSNAVENTLVGYSSGIALTSGDQNSIFGTSAGLSLTTGSDNIFIGRRAGYTVTAGNATTTASQNIFIGTEAGSSTSTQIANAIAIGYRATVGASNSMVLGNTSIVLATINGKIVNPNLVADDFADDAAAAIGGIIVGGLYHTTGAVKVRRA